VKPARRVAGLIIAAASPHAHARMNQLFIIKTRDAPRLPKTAARISRTRFAQKSGFGERR
jgi:hypothetical protein